MDKTRKKTKKQIISLICIAAAVVLLAAMPLLAKQDAQEDGPQASILSGNASQGSIQTTLIGGGTLAEEDAVTVTVPAEVKLTKFLVSNGQAVTQGDPIASVDRVSVMKAISQVQETLEYLSEQIEAASDTGTAEAVTTPAGGTVKILYAQEGESVQDVMLEHGALAVLSLDSLMAVELETESSLAVGTAVTVTLSDGTGVAGEIARNLAGEMTVTVEDDDYAVGEAVEVFTEDGEIIGSGSLSIYSPWNATAYAGTVSSISVRVGDTLSAGRTLMTLRDAGYSPAYRQLISQRQEYEELMLDLFKMYQTEAVCAPCDGVVSGIDQDSVQLLSDNGQGYVLSFLSNAPGADPDALYTNFVGQITEISDGNWYLNINPSAFSVEDYGNLPGGLQNTQTFTQSVTFTPGALQVYTRAGDEWVATSAGVGDILLFAADSNGSFVWSIKLGTAPLPEEPEDPEDPIDPEDPEDPVDPEDPEDPENPEEPEEPVDPDAPVVPDDSAESDDSTVPGFTYPSGDSLGGMTEPEAAFQLYGLETVDIAAVMPQGGMTLEITVDELDIRALYVGMEATVKIDALGGEKHKATITDIGNTGTNSGGSSKFTVELTMERSGNMLCGMNATAAIVLATAEDVLTIPADALVEQGSKTVVYTGYDEKNETLTDPVTVTVGCSDGETVEILEGLAEGQAYYYAYYDTLEISFAPDFGGGLFG